MPLARGKKGLSSQTQWLSLYALPTRHGLYMALVLLSLVALGLRVENNMLLAVVALIAVLLFFSVIWAAENMSRLTVSLFVSDVPLAGQLTPITLKLNCSMPRFGVGIVSVAKQPVFNGAFPQWRPPGRGMQSVQPIRIESYFPLYMVRVWTSIQSQPVLVAPQPLPGLAAGPQPGATANHGRDLANRPSSYADRPQGGLKENAADSPTELRPYSPGDPLARVHWRRFAQRDQLLTRGPDRQAAPPQAGHRLRYETYQHLGHERALSALCYELLRMEHQGLSWVLELPTALVESTQPHAKKNALLALALA